MWLDRAFDELPARELYAILKLRAEIFVVEQACVYLDPDGLDLVSRHLCDEPLRAYCRVVPAGAKYAEQSIGRVVVAKDARGTGLGKVLMQEAIARYGTRPIRIAAQHYLVRFYGELGFRAVSEPYDDDGIPHVDMLRL